MSFFRRAREYVGAQIVRFGVRIMGVEPFNGAFDFEEVEDSPSEPAVGVQITKEAAAMLSQPTAKKQHVSPRPPLRGSLAARAYEERRKR